MLGRFVVARLVREHEQTVCGHASPTARQLQKRTFDRRTRLLRQASERRRQSKRSWSTNRFRPAVAWLSLAIVLSISGIAVWLLGGFAYEVLRQARIVSAPRPGQPH